MGDRTADRTRSRSPSRRKTEKSPERRSKHRSHRHKSNDEDEDTHRKHRRDRREETEEERKERKRAKKDRKREDRNDREKLDVVDDDDDASMWVEKGVDTVSPEWTEPKGQADRQDAVANAPASAGMDLQSHASEPAAAPLPETTASGSQTRERDSWMLEPTISAPPAISNPFTERSTPKSAGLPSGRSQPISDDMTDGYGEEVSSGRTLDGGVDFFSALGSEHKRKDPNDDKPDPSKLQVTKMELNQQLVQGKTLDDYETKGKSLKPGKSADEVEKKVTPGGPGHQWRMMKLKRLYEQAEEQ